MAKKEKAVAAKQEEVKETQVAKVESKTVAVTGAPAPIDTMGFDKSDIIIPRLILMQGQSELVADGTFKTGDVVNMLTNEKVGNLEAPVEFVPVCNLPKTIKIMKKAPKKSRFEWEATMTQTAFLIDRFGEDALKSKTEDDLLRSMELEEVQSNGDTLRYDKCLNFYGLLSTEVARDEGFPFIITFTRSSYPAGKQLATHFMRSNMLRQKPYGKAVKLSPKMDQNDDGDKYAVSQILPSRAATGQEIQVAESWLPFLTSGKAQVQDDEVETEPTVTETKQF